jgi:hypothetical protein
MDVSKVVNSLDGKYHFSHVEPGDIFRKDIILAYINQISMRCLYWRPFV